VTYRLGVDVGGTFTDVLLVEGASGATWRAKTASTSVTLLPLNSSSVTLLQRGSWCERAARGRVLGARRVGRHACARRR
jgi:N-methylhydantoinase A/oxoprolinase/acetone carboxylase beta subunit